MAHRTARVIEQRLADERGRIEKQAPAMIALSYPSPYTVGMSSLGFQQVYRLLQGMAGVGCERFFLPDETERSGPIEAPLSYESGRRLGEFDLVAFSVAYELELAGLIRMLEASHIPLLSSDRGEADPIVIAGGPLTFSNPLPLSPFVDAIVVGEAEELLEPVNAAVFGRRDRASALDALAALPHVFVPGRHTVLPSTAACDNALLPAKSAIITPHTELRSMFLIETERGCSRGCTFCVMRRSTNGGMRVVPKETILDAIPADATRVGLVGAAVSDHPRITQIVEALAERGASVGLSSLRPDRLKRDFVFALARAGYKTLTTALDGASERLREQIDKRGREPFYRDAVAVAREAGMERVKLYLMLGLPGETDADVDECAAFVSELSRTIPIVLGIAPFCPKRNTPLDGHPFAGIDVVDARLDRLRRGVKGRVTLRATSAKWAWVESVLAKGGAEEGLALAEAVHAGASFASYRRAFENLGHSSRARAPKVSAGGRRLSVLPS